MKRLRESNCVSSAKASNLSQVRLFVSEDCPSQVGNGGQDSLKIKPTNLQHSKNHFNELPPGFERPNLTRIGRVPWNCPPKFELSYNWNVVAGEESQEVKVQELRESRVLEALYPSPAVIPANSSVFFDVEHKFYDDTLTPSIPVIPVEEEEETKSVPPCLPGPAPNSFNCQPSSLKHTLLPSGNPNLVKCNAPVQQADPAPGMLLDQNTCSVTTAAFAVMNVKEQGSLVDTDLLIRILSDPKMVSKLAKDFQKPTISAGEQIVVSRPVTQFAPPSLPNSAPGSASLPPSKSSVNLPCGSQPSSTTPSWPKPAIAAERDAVRVSAAIPTVEDLTSIAKQVQTNFNTAPSLESTVAKYVGTNRNPFLGSALMPNQPKTKAQTCVKDISYIKNLIREHGTDKTQDITFAQNVPDLNNTRPGKVSQKFQKACIYFKSPVGCRNGSDCPYQHDISCQLETGTTLEAPQFKRMRLSRKVIGRR